MNSKCKTVINQNEIAAYEYAGFNGPDNKFISQLLGMIYTCTYYRTGSQSLSEKIKRNHRR